MMNDDIKIEFMEKITEMFLRHAKGIEWDILLLLYQDIFCLIEEAYKKGYDEGNRKSSSTTAENF